MTDADDQRDPIAMPAELADAVQRELQPGESVAWWGQAQTRAALRFLFINSAWIPGFLLLVFGLPMFLVRTGYLPAAARAWLMVWTMAFGLLPAALWLGMVLWGWREVRSIVYVVTDRRVFKLRAGSTRSFVGTLPGSPLRVQTRAWRRGTLNFAITAWRDWTCRGVTTVTFALVSDVSGLAAALAAMPGVPHDPASTGELFHAAANAARPRGWKSVLLFSAALIGLEIRAFCGTSPAGLLDLAIVAAVMAAGCGATLFALRLLCWRRAFGTPPAAEKSDTGDRTHDP